MYTPIHLLPQIVSSDGLKYKKRWETKEGMTLHARIMEMIKNGAGEDFLQGDFESGKLGFLEDMHDLKGFEFFQDEIVFPPGDTFEAIDFSYGEFWHAKMVRAYFNCTIDFARFYNCTFSECIFHFNRCYASKFEKTRFINCDFIEYNSFTNCSFGETVFSNSFFSNNAFVDCRFDTKTSFVSLPRKPVIAPVENVVLENTVLSDLYRGISEAYSSGGALGKARRYLFLQLKAATRYNSVGFGEKVSGLFFELLTGYGLRPLRVIVAMVLYFLLVLCVFLTRVDLQDALLLTCGALFTFGAKTHVLGSMGTFYHLVYIFSAFVGISLTALFVTVLVNVFMRRR